MPELKCWHLSLSAAIFAVLTDFLYTFSAFSSLRTKCPLLSSLASVPTPFISFSMTKRRARRNLFLSALSRKEF